MKAREVSTLEFEDFCDLEITPWNSFEMVVTPRLLNMTNYCHLIGEDMWQCL